MNDQAPAPSPKQSTPVQSNAKEVAAATPLEPADAENAANSQPSDAKTLPDRHAHSTESSHADGMDRVSETEMPKGSQP